MTQIPVSTLYDRIRLLEQGLIKRHVCLLDFSKLGYTTSVTIFVSLSRDLREQCKDYLKGHAHVNTVLRISGDYDFQIEGIFSSLPEAQAFIEKLEDQFPIQKKAVYYHVEELKHEGFLDNPEIAHLVTKGEITPVVGPAV